MARITTANKNHGLCETCGKPILKGQSLKRTFRHATEAERTNRRARTIFPGQGPMVGVKLHADCPHPESHEGRMIREERQSGMG